MIETRYAAVAEIVFAFSGLVVDVWVFIIYAMTQTTRK